jgi:hypothetical protein
MYVLPFGAIGPISILVLELIRDGKPLEAPVRLAPRPTPTPAAGGN